jgi:hypothetical protein
MRRRRSPRRSDSVRPWRRTQSRQPRAAAPRQESSSRAERQVLRPQHPRHVRLGWCSPAHCRGRGRRRSNAAAWRFSSPSRQALPVRAAGENAATAATHSSPVPPQGPASRSTPMHGVRRSPQRSRRRRARDKCSRTSLPAVRPPSAARARAPSRVRSRGRPCGPIREATSPASAAARERKIPTASSRR